MDWQRVKRGERPVRLVRRQKIRKTRTKSVTAERIHSIYVCEVKCIGLGN